MDQKRDIASKNTRLLILHTCVDLKKTFEYLFHFEKERLRGEEWNNFRYFIRHTGKHHIVKLESREQGAFDFSYKSAELRYRQPIGKKFSVSVGAIYRTHERAYGYNPIEIWLNEIEVDDFEMNIQRIPGTL